MQPLDALTDIDENTIRSYFSIYGDTECGPLHKVLREWNKNKRTLFRAFGKHLSVSKTITIPKSDTLIYSELESIFHPYIIWYEHDITSIKDHADRLQEITNNSFVTDVLIFWVKKNYCLSDLRIISSLFLHKNFKNGYICSNIANTPYHCMDFKCTIKNGMKTVRTIQKVLKATGYSNMELFEQWKNQISLVQISNELKAKLVVSIHPIDFVSMSENSCNWRSCMGWSNKGCYHAGTLEMMNSNVAAVAYLEAPAPFEMYLNETGEVYTVPNKSWRSLIFIHKDILLLGKQYPYHNDNLTFIVLDFVRSLVQKNLHWDYRFVNQEYKDMENIDGNFYVRDFFDVGYDTKKDHHCIFVYTNGMYNDIIEAHYPHYYCCRNYVSHSKKICLSGPATCICCGDRIYAEPRYDIISYDDLGQQKICHKCLGKYCKICHKYHYHNKYVTRFGTFCSDECAKDAVIFPNFSYLKICKKEDLQMNRGSRIAIFSDEYISPSDLQSIEKEFLLLNKDECVSWIQEQRDQYHFRIYRVPSALCGWDYANISDSYPRSISCKNDYYFLNIYSNVKENNRYRHQEEVIKRLLNSAPLIEYLKEGI